MRFTPLSTGITVGSAVICWVLAALLWNSKIKLGNSRKGSGGPSIGDRRHPRLVVALLVAGSAGLVATTFGHWINHLVTSLAAWIASFANQWVGGITVTVVMVGFILALLYMLYEHLTRNDIDKWTLRSAMTLPFLAPALPGVAGAWVLAAVSWVAAVPGWALSWAFGRI